MTFERSITDGDLFTPAADLTGREATDSHAASTIGYYGQSYTAVILAGERESDRQDQPFGVDRKVLIPIAGMPMLSRTVHAIAASSFVKRIIILANDVDNLKATVEVQELLTSLHHTFDIKFHNGGSTPVESLLKVRDECFITGPVLIAAADMPLLSTDTIDEFCARAISLRGVDLAIGMIERTTVRDAFPTMRRTFIPVGDGHYKACNLFALRTHNAWSLIERWRGMEDSRKSPKRILFKLGIWSAVQALFGRLTLERGFTKLSKSFACTASPILMTDANLAVDVDRPEHLAIARGVLEQGNTAL